MWRRVCALLGAATLSCSGVIADPGESPGGGGEGPGGALVDRPAPSTRAARLSHRQWERSVRDLFHIADGSTFADALRPDPNVAGFIFENNALSMQVDQSLWGQYQRAAADVAAHVTADAGLMAALLPTDSGDPDARARRLIRELGQRAHRRPLDDAAVERYFRLYSAGTALYEGVPAFEAGVRLLIEALLQSPFFLYRVEESAGASGGVIPLDGWEVASRLSYLLWNTMPDDALFAAAAAGELEDPEAVAGQVTRMLDDPRAEDVVADFHRQLLEVDEFTDIDPPPAFFPDVSPDLDWFATTENDLFVRSIFNGGGGWVELLTSNETFVNDELARIYGLDDALYGTDFVRATLDPTQRRGLFTQVGFLAANAAGANPDPIHRGVFLAERIACNHIAAPPAMIPALPPPMGRTNRETVEDHTEAEGSVCATCHATLINPFGFAYENFDSAGQWRDEDAGFPVDATSAPRIGDRSVPVLNGVELADVLATSLRVHECYTAHWIEYGFGRPEAVEDRGIVHTLGELSLDGASVREVLTALVTSRAFLTRSTKELP